MKTILMSIIVVFLLIGCSDSTTIEGNFEQDSINFFESQEQTKEIDQEEIDQEEIYLIDEIWNIKQSLQQEQIYLEEKIEELNNLQQL